MAWTLTPLLAALVLHTQMANVAVWPDLTSLDAAKDSTLTQSWGVFVLWGGGDLLELGVGVGLGDLPDELGDGDGDVGLDELSVGGDELLDFALEPEALGVDEGLALAESLDDGDALGEALGDAESELLGEAALLLIAEPLGKADALVRAVLLEDAEADADSLGLWLRGSMMAAVSTVSFGSDEHAG